MNKYVNTGVTVKTFVQPDLHLYLYQNFGAQAEKIQLKDASGYFTIFIVTKGRATIKSHDKLQKIQKGQIFIANQTEDYLIDFDKRNFEYIRILVSSGFIRSLDKSYDLFAPFKDKDSTKIYTADTELENFDFVANSVKKTLLTRSSRVFALKSTLDVLCEINYAYEKTHNVQIKQTDSTYAKIVYCIDNRLFERLTLEDVSKDTFLSKRCICYNVKKHTGMTFLEYLNHRRLRTARESIINSRESLVAIASRFGFNTYSTFYRNYQKEFGYAPSDEKRKYFK